MGTETTEQVTEELTPEQTARDIEDRLAKDYEQADGAPLKAAKQPDNDQDASPDAKSEEGDGLEEVGSEREEVPQGRQ